MKTDIPKLFMLDSEQHPFLRELLIQRSSHKKTALQSTTCTVTLWNMDLIWAASGIAMVTSERKNQGLHKPRTTKMKWNQLAAICDVTILREGQMARWMHDLHIMAQLWHHSPSAPMDTSFTPLLAIKSSALLTFEILWTLILPLSGLAKRSPEQEEADRLVWLGYWYSIIDVSGSRCQHCI